MHRQKKIKNLLEKYIAGDCTEVELQQLAQYFTSRDNASILKGVIRNMLESTATENKNDAATQAATDAVFYNIRKKINGTSGAD